MPSDRHSREPERRRGSSFVPSTSLPRYDPPSTALTQTRREPLPQYPPQAIGQSYGYGFESEFSQLTTRSSPDGALRTEPSTGQQLPSFGESFGDMGDTFDPNEHWRARTDRFWTGVEGREEYGRQGRPAGYPVQEAPTQQMMTIQGYHSTRTPMAGAASLGPFAPDHRGISQPQPSYDARRSGGKRTREDEYRQTASKHDNHPTEGYDRIDAPERRRVSKMRKIEEDEKNKMRIIEEDEKLKRRELEKGERRIARQRRQAEEQQRKLHAKIDRENWKVERAQNGARKHQAKLQNTAARERQQARILQERDKKMREEAEAAQARIARQERTAREKAERRERKEWEMEEKERRRRR